MGSHMSDDLAAQVEKLQAEKADLQRELISAYHKIAALKELFEGDAIAYLRTVYNNPNYELRERLRAAEAALPYERPKLSASMLVEGSKGASGHQLAERLKEARGTRLTLVPPDDAA